LAATSAPIRSGSELNGENVAIGAMTAHAPQKMAFVSMTSQALVRSIVGTAQTERPSIKQHLCIRHFYGTSENAVKTQIWTALCVYVLAAIVKKQLALDVSLYTFLQVLSVPSFER
jgi:hypothetical protein